MDFLTDVFPAQGRSQRFPYEYNTTESSLMYIIIIYSLSQSRHTRAVISVLVLIIILALAGVTVLLCFVIKQ